jgi:hypothetical protein
MENGEEFRLDVPCPLCGKKIRVYCFQSVQIDGRSIRVNRQGSADLPETCPDECVREAVD